MIGPEDPAALAECGSSQCARFFVGPLVVIGQKLGLNLFGQSNRWKEDKAAAAARIMCNSCLLVFFLIFQHILWARVEAIDNGKKVGNCCRCPGSGKCYHMTSSCSWGRVRCCHGSSTASGATVYYCHAGEHQILPVKYFDFFVSTTRSRFCMCCAS